MATLRTYFDCVQYFKMRMEKCGYRFDFIDNPYTGSQFVVINGCRAKVRGCGACTPITEIYSALQDACKEAWQKATAPNGGAKQWKHEYIASSERSHRRSDEQHNTIRTNHEYTVGQQIELDGLLWTIEKVVR